VVLSRHADKGVNEIHVFVSSDSASSEDGRLAELIALLHFLRIRVVALFSAEKAMNLESTGTHC
jgi:hypothetical protein